MFVHSFFTWSFFSTTFFAPLDVLPIGPGGGGGGPPPAPPTASAGVLAEDATSNGMASASIAGVVGARHFMTGVIVSWTAAPTAAYKTLTVKFGSTTVAIFRFDPLKHGLVKIPFEPPIHGDYGQEVSVELSASGTGGVSGRATLFGFTQ
jgi:hypothetical protein